MPRRSPFVIQLTEPERAELEARCKVYTSPHRDVIRAKIVLLASWGLGNDRIAAQLGTPRHATPRHATPRHARSPAGGGSGSTFIGCRVSRIVSGGEEARVSGGERRPAA